MKSKSVISSIFFYFIAAFCTKRKKETYRVVRIILYMINSHA